MIALYSIKLLVFITETECVYCAVRTVSLKMEVKFCFLWTKRNKTMEVHSAHLTEPRSLKLSIEVSYALNWETKSILNL